MTEPDTMEVMLTYDDDNPVPVATAVMMDEENWIINVVFAERVA